MIKIDKSDEDYWNENIRQHIEEDDGEEEVSSNDEFAEIQEEE